VTPNTLAIVPAFNEAASVADVVRRISSSGLGIDVLVVDDGSRDATAAIARDAGARVVELPFNLGIGGAVQTGYRYALENDYDYAIQIDGDGQHDPNEAAALLERIQQEPRVGMVYGTRFAEEGGFRSSSMRRVGIKIFATTLSLVTRQKVTDPTSGFRVCDRSAIALFARDYPIDYPEVEAIMLMHRHRLRSAEVPVKMSERSGGSSSITLLRSGFYMIKVLLAVLIGLFRAPEKAVKNG
jgi:glycosyltransferase involved in cell wall biosynthesis